MKNEKITPNSIHESFEQTFYDFHQNFALVEDTNAATADKMRDLLAGAKKDDAHFVAPAEEKNPGRQHQKLKSYQNRKLFFTNCIFLKIRSKGRKPSSIPRLRSLTTLKKNNRQNHAGRIQKQF